MLGNPEHCENDGDRKSAEHVTETTQGEGHSDATSSVKTTVKEKKKKKDKVKNAIQWQYAGSNFLMFRNSQFNTRHGNLNTEAPSLQVFLKPLDKR